MQKVIVESIAWNANQKSNATNESDQHSNTYSYARKPWMFNVRLIGEENIEIDKYNSIKSNKPHSCAKIALQTMHLYVIFQIFYFFLSFEHIPIINNHLSKLNKD